MHSSGGGYCVVLLGVRRASRPAGRGTATLVVWSPDLAGTRTHSAPGAPARRLLNVPCHY
jgi:hypothetical protein